MKRPLEFIIENKEWNSGNSKEVYLEITFFYEDGSTSVLDCDINSELPRGLELGKHYLINDLFSFD